MVDLNNAKWELSKNEKYAVKWMYEHGFDTTLTKQYVSKTVFMCRKNGYELEFDVNSNVTDMRAWMLQFERSFDMYVKIKEMERKEVADG